MTTSTLGTSRSPRFARWCALAILVVVGAAVVWPAVALMIEPMAASLARGDATTVPSPRAQGAIILPDGAFLGTGELLLGSVLWIAGIASLAVLLGWPVGLVLADRLRQGRGRLAAFLLCVPLCLPGYLMFWSLWHLVEPSTWLGDRLLRWNAAVALRETTMVIGLTLWAVPIVGWCVAAARLTRPDPNELLRRLDGAGRGERLRAAWRHDRRTLLVAGCVAALGLLGESVSFDLAQVRTYGFELRSLDLSGAPATAVLAAGWPACLVALALVVAVWWGSGRTGRHRAERVASSGVARSTDRWLRAGAIAVTLAVVALPAALLAQLRSGRDLEVFLSLYARPTVTSIELAAAAGLVVGLTAMAFVVVELRGSGRLRRVAWLAGAALALAASVPATIVAIGLENAWNHPIVGPPVYDTPVILLLAFMARFGVVALIVGRLAAATIGRGTRQLIALDDPRRVGAIWRLGRPALMAAGLVAGLAGSALAFSEIVVTSRLQPPRLQLLATSTLNAIHYQQPETVLLASGGAILLGVLGGGAAVLFLLRRVRPAAAGGVATLGLVAIAASLSLVGCAPPVDEHQPAPLPAVSTFGTSGFGPGQFRTPRAVAFEPSGGHFYVVDKEARIQRFARDGTYELEWHMPERKVGKPVGLGVHPDGRVFVADTHYNRVVVFDPEGHELARFGSYGKEPGQFIYPTDVAIGNDGRIYVGEYGGHDRIQVFSPDLTFVGEFGEFGTGEGQLSRPQGLEFDRERNELYVADSNNHRIVVYDPEGKRLRQWGVPGIEVGQLSYPRGIVFCGDGSVMVVEFGNHRVQQFDAQPGPHFGTSLGVWGGMCAGVAERSNIGDGTHQPEPLEEGRLKYPWDMAGVAGHVMVLDSGNNRVMLARLPS